MKKAAAPSPEWDLAAEAAARVRQADPALARRHGVFATPPALTGWVVRSVHALLQDRFGLGAGLADGSIRLLDPAAGPANFLVEAWRVAVAEHRARNGSAGVLRLLEDHLLPHSRGFELLSLPADLGGLAVRRFLAAHGSRPPAGSGGPLLRLDALAGPPPFFPEPGTVAVVVGNPPFAGGAAAPGWGSELVRAWRPAGERCIRWLQGDAVRFLGLAEWIVRRHGKGVVGLVLPHALLDAPTFRELRRALLRTFDGIWALDLHGNARRREAAPDGGRDRNVFRGVAQGAAVLLAVRGGEDRRGVYQGDLWGRREVKLAALAGSDVRSTAWRASRPAAPGLTLRARGGEEAWDEECGVPLPALFPFHTTGLVTGRDAAFTALDRTGAEERLLALRRAGASREPAVPDLATFLAGPFDLRHLVYAPRLLARPRVAVAGGLRRGGLALLATRGGPAGPAVFATRWLAGHKVVSPYEVNALFPLYLPGLAGGRRRPNLSPALLAALAALYGRRPGPLAVLACVYAILHAPAYAASSSELFRQGFPRLPWPRRAGLFSALAAAGRELLRLHLLCDARLRRSPALPAGAALAPEVCGYAVGGAPVAARWLRARAGRPLTWPERCDLGRLAEAVRLCLEVRSRLDPLFLAVLSDPAVLPDVPEAA